MAAMSAELVRARGFEPHELADQMRAAVSGRATRRELRRRGFDRTVHRLGGDAISVMEYAERLIAQDMREELAVTEGISGRATFVVVASAEDPSAIGMATVTGDFRPRTYPVPLPRKMARHLPFLGIEEIPGHANMAGWTTAERAAELGRVYTGLLAQVPRGYGYISWAMEPVRSPLAVHRALAEEAGMTRAGEPERLYNMDESGWLPEPVSQIYIHRDT